MALTKNQDNNSNKKEPGKKEADKKVTAKKDVVLSKDKKETAKKDSGKRELTVKKDKVNRVEQAQKFFRGVLYELKKVHWPNRREITIYTLVVLVAVLVVGVLIWVFDTALSSILKLVIKR